MLTPLTLLDGILINPLLRSKISKTNAYRQYLAYHEGHGGYNNKTYENKAWLIDIAKNVEKKSNTYKSQLSQCRDQSLIKIVFGRFSN